MHNKTMKDFKSEDYYKIIQRRDPAFDGRFYFGVTTTKIYCRPTCSAKPHQKNILIFKSPSHAELAGFRACKRCKPDLFPGQRCQDEKFLAVGKALELIETKTDIENIEDLSSDLHMTSRHLRRLFQEYLGASPNDVLSTHRLHTAKKFLLETNEKIIDIAFATGFKSLRRFNEAFKELYHEAPSSMRKKLKAHDSQNDSILLIQGVRAPYDWNYVLAYLDRHLIFGQEFIDKNSYTRYFVNKKNNLSKAVVTFDKNTSTLQYRFYEASLLDIQQQIPKLNRLFDIKHVPQHLPIKGLKNSIRVPTHYEAFEVAVSIIISQLISTDQAKKKLADLIQIFGQKLENPFDKNHEIILFPAPEKLKTSEIEKVRIPKVKAEAIRQLSSLVANKEIILDSMQSCDLIKKKLLSVKGIGPWTVEVIAMRCLGDTDAFPASDLLVRKALLEKAIVADQHWIGQRSYLCHLVWRDSKKRIPIIGYFKYLKIPSVFRKFNRIQNGTFLRTGGSYEFFKYDRFYYRSKPRHW